MCACVFSAIQITKKTNLSKYSTHFERFGCSNLCKKTLCVWLWLDSIPYRDMKNWTKNQPVLDSSLWDTQTGPMFFLFFIYSACFSDSQFHEIQQTMWNSAAKFQSPPGGRMTRNFSPHRPRLQAISPRWVPGVFSAGGRGACFRSLLMLEIIMVTSMFFMCSMIVPPIMVKSPDINLTYGKSLR